MAYSDYGGYAYKNKELRIDHCDRVLYYENSEEDIHNYPFFFTQEAQDKNNYPNMHVSLGDMKVRVGLYKQSTFQIYKDGEMLNSLDVLSDKSKIEVENYKTDYVDDKTQRPYFNDDAFTDRGRIAYFDIGDGYLLEMFWEQTDNYYQYAKLTQPDGSVWTGFSGYGVGNQLEDCGYGFSTKECSERLEQIFSQ